MPSCRRAAELERKAALLQLIEEVQHLSILLERSTSIEENREIRNSARVLEARVSLDPALLSQVRHIRKRAEAKNKKIRNEKRVAELPQTTAALEKVERRLHQPMADLNDAYQLRREAHQIIENIPRGQEYFDLRRQAITIARLIDDRLESIKLAERRRVTFPKPLKASRTDKINDWVLKTYGPKVIFISPSGTAHLAGCRSLGGLARLPTGWGAISRPGPYLWLRISERFPAQATVGNTSLTAIQRCRCCLHHGDDGL